MKKLSLGLVILLVLLLCAVSAQGEVSTNLHGERLYNAQNQLIEQRYLDAEGNLVVADDLGYAVAKYEYKNRVISHIAFYDAEMQPVNCAQGYAEMRASVTVKRVVTDIKYLDTEGNLVMGPEGFAHQTSQYWSKKQILTRNLDENDELIRSDTLFAEHESFYKNTKLSSHTLIGDAYRDADGNLMIGPDGYARSEIVYDGTSIVSTSYYDTEGNLTLNTTLGYASTSFDYTYGRVSRESWYGADGQLVPGPKGYAYVTTEYPSSAVSVRFYYNADGTPYLVDGDYFGVRTTLGNRNRVEGLAYYGPDGERTMISKGYSRMDTKYTTRGQVTQRVYYDENDQKIDVESLGYATLINEYYSWRLQDSYYLDANGEPANCADGYHKVLYGYDANRKVNAETYEDLGGNRVATVKGYSKISYDNDENGNHLRITYLDPEDQPFVMEDGYDEIQYEYDETLKCEERYYLGGEPVLTSKGYHKITYTYNANNKVITTAYYGLDGAPILIHEGYSAKTNLYTRYGDIAATLYTDTEGEILTPNGSAYAYALKEYGDNQQSYTVSYHTADGAAITLSSGIAQVRYTLDSLSNIIREERLDLSGNPINASDGIGEIRRVYEKKRLLEESYFRCDGEPVPGSSGYARVARKYDTLGNLIEERYYGTDGKSLTLSKGYAVMRRSYQGKQLIGESYFSADDTPVPCSDGYASYERVNDSKGRAIVLRYFDAAAFPVRASAGYAEIRRAYNAAGQIISESYFDENGMPCPANDTYAGLSREHHTGILL